MLWVHRNKSLWNKVEVVSLLAHVPKIIKRGFQDKPRVRNLGDEGT